MDWMMPIVFLNLMIPRMPDHLPNDPKNTITQKLRGF